MEGKEVFANFRQGGVCELYGYGIYERGRMVKELGPEEKRMEKKQKRDRVKKAVNGARKGTKDVLFGFVEKFFGSDEDKDEGEEDMSALVVSRRKRRNHKERHFVSIMNELKYVWDVGQVAQT